MSKLDLLRRTPMRIHPPTRKLPTTTKMSQISNSPTTPADSGLDAATCSASIVSDKTNRINAEVRAENGESEQKRRRLCQSKQMSRTAVIATYGDPRDWEDPCPVCGGEEPCTHNFDSIVWPNDQGDGRRDGGPTSPPTSSPFHPPSC